jgi:hypothetical protein
MLKRSEYKKIDTLAEAKNRNMICNTLFTFKSERVKRQAR